MASKKTTKPSATKMVAEFKSSGIPAQYHADLEKAMTAGFSWPQLLALVIQFGPQVIALAPQILAALEAGSTQKVIDALQALYSANEGLTAAMLQAVAALFGLVVPTLST